MHIDTLRYNNDGWSMINQEITFKSEASIIFLFGDSDVLRTRQNFDELKQLYPSANIVGASSSGNILGSEISADPVVATAIHLEKGSISVSKVDISDGENVEALTLRLINQLPQQNLKHIFVMSDGLNVNGSELTCGMNKKGGSFTISGGMAGMVIVSRIPGLWQMNLLGRIGLWLLVFMGKT